jgi:hypothetical protein
MQDPGSRRPTIPNSKTKKTKTKTKNRKLKKITGNLFGVLAAPAGNNRGMMGRYPMLILSGRFSAWVRLELLPKFAA